MKISQNDQLELSSFSVHKVMTQLSSSWGFVLQEHGVNKIFKLESDRLDAGGDKWVNILKKLVRLNCMKFMLVILVDEYVFRNYILLSDSERVWHIAKIWILRYLNLCSAFTLGNRVLLEFVPVRELGGIGVG